MDFLQKYGQPFRQADEEIVDEFIEASMSGTSFPDKEDFQQYAVGIFFGWVDPEWEFPLDKMTEAQQAAMYREVRRRIILFTTRAGLTER